MKFKVGDLVKWDGINNRGRISRRSGVIISVIPKNEIPKIPELFVNAKAVFGNESRTVESYLILSEDGNGRRYLYWPRPHLLGELFDKGQYSKVKILLEGGLDA